MRAPRPLAKVWSGLWLVCAIGATVAIPAYAQTPVAADDAYGTAPLLPLNIDAANGVLANDTNGGSGELQAVLVSTATNGALLLSQNGGFFYLPNPGFIGSDSFTYQASNGITPSNVATVTISVNIVNDPPVAGADSYSTDENAPLNVNRNNGVLNNDTDAERDNLTAALVIGPASGTLTLDPDGAFRYTPAAGFAGTATFTYQAVDGNSRSNIATVTITVVAVNKPPTAQPDSFTTNEDTTLTVVAAGVLANDTDPDAGTTLTAVLDRNVTNGTLTLQPNGGFTYAPSTNFSGSTTFTYHARDGAASSAPVTVTIAVTATNDPPFVSNAPATTATEGVTYRYTLASSDPDGNAVQVSAPTLPSWLRFQAPATISGTPQQSDVGTHDVTMQITDGIANPVQLKFRVAVQAVDNEPVIKTIPAQTATEAAPFDFDIAAFVSDIDTATSALRYRATGALPAGLTLSAAGRLSGTPTLGTSVGTHTVRFVVADAENDVPGQFSLTVLPAGRVDLAVTLTAAPNPVSLEAVATWTIGITNRAPAVEAQGVSLTGVFIGDVLYRLTAPTTPGCTATPSGNTTNLSCTLGPLAGGATTTITLTGRGSFAGDVFGTATVSATGSSVDEVPGNDRASTSLSVAQRVSSAPAQRIPNVVARAVAAADFDGDGFDELAVATGSSQGLLLFANGTDPANAGRRALTTTPQMLGGEGLANDVAVADIDRDGDLDLIVAAASGAPDRAFLSAAGSFTSAALRDASIDSRAVTVGDVNGDAFPDLVFANATGSTVLVNRGSGGTFTVGATVGAGDTRDALLVDLGGDSLPDLVLANGNGDAGIYRNNAGTFTLERTLPTGPTVAVATGDFNADGRADLVFGRVDATPPATPSALVFINAAAAGSQFVATDELGAASTTSMLVRDFNLDGRTDVLAVNGSGERLFTNAGAANGTFTLHPQQIAAPSARGAAAGRFSNDDRIDVAVVGDGISVFVNDGTGSFGSGDTGAPTLTLRGEPTVTLTIDSPYADAGATATDAVDGDLSSRIVVANPVNTALLGTYTITYSVTDLSGNAAAPLSRTVTVQAQADDGGGGGALGIEVLLALLAALLYARPRTFARVSKQ